ncbi:hypothetical protein NM688_g964 [Phlebia brevispora]|uniref:Uncharacterized protein n=1 Tax=Phlebia brevispora TaxID=194682 RepID=A0ACC1TCU0_9APHY|nr:hypothetical protein NM688_g964 [Phlebia brevispora]
MIEQLLAGLETEFVVAHDRGQYSEQGGASSCGLAALNCARVVLGKDKCGLHGVELLHAINRPETFEEVLGLCASWSSSAHLDVEDIYQTPIFHRSLSLVKSEYGHPNLGELTRLLSSLQQTTVTSKSPACAVITRPPEIISCFCIPVDGTEVFIIFDSHPRPNLHPEGAAFICYSLSDGAAKYLSQLLRYDPAILDEDAAWQAQLLGNFSGHIFVSNAVTADDDWINATLEASLQVLHFHAESLHLRSQHSTLKSENSRLRKELAWYRGEGSTFFSSSYARSLHTSSAGPSQQSSYTHPNRNEKADSYAPSTRSSRRVHSTRQHDSLSREDGGSVATYYAHASGTATNARQRGTSSKSGTSPRVDKHVISDAEYAVQLQLLYNEEHLQLLNEREKLNRSTLRIFECGVCLESFSEDFVSEVAKCLHRYCRDCIRRHVSSELDARHFPILCPICKADRHCKEPAGKFNATLARYRTGTHEDHVAVLDNAFVQHIGLSEAEYALYTEMELAPFATRCNQNVNPDGPEHSCDGTNELDHLMDQKGWKYCPGCRTPAEKIEGCNHMACTTPGCNMHFCYLCGSAIICSVNRHEIGEALAAHYRQCRMFDDVPEE